MRNKKTGKLGENYASQFLKAQDYRILHTNFYCRFGEIDIIALKDRQLIFIEVKTRTGSTFGEPQESFTWSKKQKLLKTALHFLNSASPKQSFSWRMDLIALKLNPQGGLRQLTHFKNILDG